MKRQLVLVGILLRKDLRLFWHFAALIAILLGLQQIPALVALLGPLGGILQQLLIPLSTFLLVLLVCYEDSVVSVKHDWLTRPIPGPTLLLAKILFLLGAIVLPPILGDIANNLHIGYSVPEALLAGVSFGPLSDKLLLIGLVMAFAAITTGIRQAMIVFLSGFVVLAVLSALVARQIGTGEGTWYSGSSWVGGLALQLSMVALAAAVLWIQYWYRRTRAARVVVLVALIAGPILVASMTWPRVFAVQKLFSPDPSAAASVQVQVAKGCFPAAVLLTDPRGTSGGAAVGIVPTRFSEAQRRRAGPGAIAFMTQLVRTGIPTGDLLTVGRAAVTYRIAGAAIEPAHAEPDPMRGPPQWKATPDGSFAWDDYWLLSRNDFGRLAAAHGVETQIDYSLTLAAPAAQARFLADGRRASFSGIGYCGASLDRATGVVNIDCFKGGAQPSQFMANLDGASQSERRASGVPNFRPAVLSFLGGQRRTMQLRTTGNEVPRVNVTAYQVRASFDRQFVVPGVFGGPVPECPAP